MLSRKKILIGFTLLAGIILLAAKAGLAFDPDAKADLVNNAGEKVGEVVFKQGVEGVLMIVTAKNLTPGKHGLHFHAVGSCADMEKFTSAGGHANMHKKEHGLLNLKGPHEGDLPNLYVQSDGTVQAEFYTQTFSLNGQAGAANLLDEDGSVFMVHAKEDDHMTDPSGGSGDRIACGVIEGIIK